MQIDKTDHTAMMRGYHRGHHGVYNGYYEHSGYEWDYWASADYSGIGEYGMNLLSGSSIYFHLIY